MFTKVIRRTLAILGLLALTAVAGLTAYFQLLKPARAKAPQIRVRSTPERVARGKYIYALTDCDGCHSPRDFSRFGGPVIESRRASGNVMPAELGLPGLVVASNITPDPETGIGSWTDGEKIRAIRDGLRRDGAPLFPMMPYTSYREMSDEDVECLVAYLNSLPPVANALPRSRIDFPVSMLMRTAPRPAGAVPPPDTGDKLAYGHYLTTLGLCGDCHTQHEKGRPVKGMEFAGGRVFRFPGATVVASNITPDHKTGLGTWSEAAFLIRFSQYRTYLKNPPPAVGPEGFTLMPWLSFSQLPPEDLSAIFAYLRTLKPVQNAVNPHPSAAQPVSFYSEPSTPGRS